VGVVSIASLANQNRNKIAPRSCEW